MKKFLEDSWVEYTSTIDKYLPNKIVAIRQHKYFKYIVIFTAFQLVAYAVVAMIGLKNWSMLGIRMTSSKRPVTS